MARSTIAPPQSFADIFGMKHGRFFGIKIEDALTIQATFEGILTLKNDECLGLEFHMAPGACSTGGRDDGSAGTFASDEAIAREILRIYRFGDGGGFLVQVLDPGLDGGGSFVDLLAIFVDIGLEGIVFASLFFERCLSIGQGRVEIVDFRFDLGSHFFEVFDLAFQRGVVAGVRDCRQFCIGVCMAFFGLFKFALFGFDQFFCFVQAFCLVLERLFEIGEHFSVVIDFKSSFFDIEPEGFLSEVQFLEFNQLFELVQQGIFSKFKNKDGPLFQTE